jgi:hypothetical protein
MPLIRCTSCGYANATDAKACKRCAKELRVPPHLMSCPFCGSLNPITGTACVWCYRKLPSSWRKFRGWPTRVVVGSMAAAMIAVLAYYAYPRGLPQETPRALTLTPAPPAQGRPMPEAKLPTTDAPRAERQPAETPKAKASPVAVARPQASAARKPGERAADCAENLAALGLCGKTETQEPPRPQNCTEAVAALGLCEFRTTQGRE